jgi:hypothetical protein
MPVLAYADARFYPLVAVYIVFVKVGSNAVELDTCRIIFSDSGSGTCDFSAAPCFVHGHGSCVLLVLLISQSFIVYSGKQLFVQ